MGGVETGPSVALLLTQVLTPRTSPLCTSGTLLCWRLLRNLCRKTQGLRGALDPTR